MKPSQLWKRYETFAILLNVLDQARHNHMLEIPPIPPGNPNERTRSASFLSTISLYAEGWSNRHAYRLLQVESVCAPLSRADA